MIDKNAHIHTIFPEGQRDVLQKYLSGCPQDRANFLIYSHTGPIVTDKDNKYKRSHNKPLTTLINLK